MEKQRLFVDMDGTLAVFTPVDTLETLYEEGYFLHLKPQQNVVDAVKQIITNKGDISSESYMLHMVSYARPRPFALQEEIYLMNEEGRIMPIFA